MTVNTVLFLETKSVLMALKDSGARIGIISTKFRYRIKELLNQHFPDDFLDIIIGGEDVKPLSRLRKVCCLPSSNSMLPKPRHYTSATVR